MVGCNILLDLDQKVAKLADFGLSRIKTASYAGSNMRGTLLYSAPEMLLDGILPHRLTDIYAMGLIFWDIFFGKVCLAQCRWKYACCQSDIREIPQR
jgi:serine/threonine protein kinase